MNNNEFYLSSLFGLAICFTMAAIGEIKSNQNLDGVPVVEDPVYYCQWGEDMEPVPCPDPDEWQSLEEDPQEEDYVFPDPCGLESVVCEGEEGWTPPPGE